MPEERAVDIEEMVSFMHSHTGHSAYHHTVSGGRGPCYIAAGYTQELRERGSGKRVNITVARMRDWTVKADTEREERAKARAADRWNDRKEGLNHDV